MIEQLVSDRECTRCGQWKPTTAYSPCAKGPGGLHSYCKACRSVSVNAARKRKRKKREEIWPRPLMQGLLDVNARKWRGPVNADAPLIWSIA